MRQIEAGAPVDVYAPASKEDIAIADRKGLIAAGTKTDFAENTLTLVIPVNAKSTIRSFEELKALGIRKIAVGNPKTSPAGKYAEKAFAYYKILDSIKDKLILTENVRQALDYVARGEVDAAVVYSTDARTRANEVRIATFASEVSHEPIVYPIASVKGTKVGVAARKFITTVTSAEGKKILEKYGFKAIKP